MKESNVIRTILVTAVVTVMAIPAIAGATPFINEADRAAVRVSFADLDLSNEAGLATLYARLRSASLAVCGSRSLIEAGSLEQLVANKRCFDSALSKAVARIGNDKLSEIHAG
jgi:UrcA family protein